jgi:DNA-binding IclR family transcriptional regulator
MDPNGTSRTLKTTDTSLSIVEYIAENGGARLTELAEEFDRSKATIHSHLATLWSRGYLVREGDTYRISLKFLHIGSIARQGEPRYDLVRDSIDGLTERSFEEADFDVEEHGRLISLYNEVGNEPESRFRYYYMHNTAVGKAMLAEFPPERVDQIVERWGLPQTTEFTITTRADLEENLERIRERGYAWSDQEFRVGLTVVGAVVHEPDGSIFGGISLGAPVYRIEEVNFDRGMTERVLSAVDRLETTLEEYDRDD